MAKSIGLAKTDKKILEFVPFIDDGNCAASLYVQAKAFYIAFRTVFGNGYETILVKNGAKFDVPKVIIGPCLVNYHFSVELMLKSLIALKGITPDKTHDLIKLLKIASSNYPQLDTLNDNLEIKLFLKEISKIGIRYAEGALCLRHNICETKKPLQELSENMEYTFDILKHTFENAR